MPKFLFTVDIPSVRENHTGLEHPDWVRFSDAAGNRTKLAKGCQKLQKNVWLIDAAGNLPLLADLLVLSQTNTLPYSAHLIPDGDVAIAPIPKQ